MKIDINHNNILITGFPRTGKTTLIKKIINFFKNNKNLNEYILKGFYTEEIRSNNKRVGFCINIIQTNEKYVFAHYKNIKSPYKVGKYKVNISILEKYGIKALDDDEKKNNKNIFIVDEIGKMECFSNVFKKKIKELLDSSNIFIGTVAFKGEGFIKEVKQRKDIKLIKLEEDNREKTFHFIIDFFKNKLSLKL